MFFQAQHNQFREQNAQQNLVPLLALPKKMGSEYKREKNSLEIVKAGLKLTLLLF